MMQWQIYAKTTTVVQQKKPTDCQLYALPLTTITKNKIKFKKTFSLFSTLKTDYC